MSDAQNLNDFFAQNSKKKKNAKKPAAAAKAKPAAAEQTREEEVKEEATSPAVQPEEQKATPAQDFEDSDDDESNQIVLNEGRQKIVDRKDIEASKKKGEETADATAGWGLGSKLGEVSQGPTSASTAQPSAARATGAQGGGRINFGKPQFSRKQKGIMDQQDFPDLADAASGSANNASPGESKANSAMMFSGGAAARGPRAVQSNEENKVTAGPEKTKPVFRGKGKFTTGGASNEEMANSRMNYDFSKMRMSAATTKTAGERAAGADGENRGDDDGERRRPRQQNSMNAQEDDDFEVVTDKKKAVKRQIF